LHNDLTQSRTDHPSTTQTSTLSLHDALPIYTECQPPAITGTTSSTSSTPMCMYDTATLTATADAGATINWYDAPTGGTAVGTGRSEEHTSELQSRENLVCRLLLDKIRGCTG